MQFFPPLFVGISDGWALVTVLGLQHAQLVAGMTESSGHSATTSGGLTWRCVGRQSVSSENGFVSL